MKTEGAFKSLLNLKTFPGIYEYQRRSFSIAGASRPNTKVPGTDPIGGKVRAQPKGATRHTQRPDYSAVDMFTAIP